MGKVIHEINEIFFQILQNKKVVNEQVLGKKLQEQGRGDRDPNEPRPSNTNTDGRDLAPPLKGNLVVTSKMGSRWGRQHRGIDLRASSGTEFYSPADGTVDTVEEQTDCGNTIIINHDNGFRSVFCHPKEVQVVKGQRVVKGQTLGLTGGAANDPGNGNSTQPHLHYSLTKNGVQVDPEDYLNAPYTSAPSASHTDDEDESAVEEVYNRIKSTINLSNMSREEKAELLSSLEKIGKVGGSVALYALLDKILKKVSTGSTSTSSSGSDVDVTAKWIGNLVRLMLPG